MKDDRKYLAFETGGSKLVAGLAGPDGRLLATHSIKRGPTDRAPRSFARLVHTAERLLDDQCVPVTSLGAIGFGFGGTVRRSTNSPHICLHEDGWSEVDVVGELRDRFEVPVFVENDCKLAALAEAHYGAGRRAPTVFYMTLGTGVGGGYVRNGRIVEMGDFGEAEIGHLVVDRTGPLCCCGNRGCVEAICSGPGLVQLGKALASRFPSQWANSDLPDQALETSTGSHRIMTAWEKGDGFADLVVRRAMAGLARAVGSVINLMAPSRIVVGGGLGGASPRMLDLLRSETSQWVVPYFRDSYSIVPSLLRTSVVTQGAAILARQRREGDRDSGPIAAS